MPRSFLVRKFSTNQRRSPELDPRYSQLLDSYWHESTTPQYRPSAVLPTVNVNLDIGNRLPQHRAFTQLSDGLCDVISTVLFIANVVDVNTQRALEFLQGLERCMTVALICG